MIRALTSAILLVLLQPGVPALAAAPLPDAELRSLVADGGGARASFPAPVALAEPLAQLGKLLFFSRSLSGSRDVACATCHHPLLAGGDALSLPIGEAAEVPELLGPGRRHALPGTSAAAHDPKADGRANVPRNSPTTFNSGLYQQALFLDGRVTALAGDEQVGIYTPDSVFGQADPLAGESLLAAQTRFPVTSFEEMRGFAFEVGGTTWQVRDALITRLRAGEQRSGGARHAWRAAFQAAFGADRPDHEIITFANLARALAAYQQSQRFTDHTFDRYLAGDAGALSAEQKRGAELFYAPRVRGGAGCARCHAGAFLTDEGYHNLAMPQLGRGKSKRENDFGRELVTREPQLRYAFRTPSLLNVALTGPWGHAGAFDRLIDVVRHHLDPAASIGRFDASAVAQFVGQPPWRNWERNTRAALRHAGQHAPQDVQPLVLPDTDVAALVAFLQSLTDPCAVSPQCLAAWIPAPKEDPDGWQLNARFAGDPSPADL